MFGFTAAPRWILLFTEADCFSYATCKTRCSSDGGNLPLNRPKTNANLIRSPCNAVNASALISIIPVEIAIGTIRSHAHATHFITDIKRYVDGVVRSLNSEFSRIIWQWKKKKARSDVTQTRYKSGWRDRHRRFYLISSGKNM